MKKTWEEPQILVQKFIPNEYVAACGDSGTVYRFKCDAGNGVYGSVYEETNGREGLQTSGWKADRLISYYSRDWWGNESGFHACEITHEAESNSVFSAGYYCAQGDKTHPVPVIIWKGDKGDDVHCTTNLNKNDWETAKS